MTSLTFVGIIGHCRTLVRAEIFPIDWSYLDFVLAHQRLREKVLYQFFNPCRVEIHFRKSVLVSDASIFSYPILQSLQDCIV